MNIPNHNNSAKPIFLASIIVISIVALGFLMPTAFGAHPPGFDNVTKTVDAGFGAFNDIYSIRNINNPLDQVDDQIPPETLSCQTTEL